MKCTTISSCLDFLNVKVKPLNACSEKGKQVYFCLNMKMYNNIELSRYSLLDRNTSKNTLIDIINTHIVLRLLNVYIDINTKPMAFIHILFYF